MHVHLFKPSVVALLGVFVVRTKKYEVCCLICVKMHEVALLGVVLVSTVNEASCMLCLSTWSRIGKGQQDFKHSSTFCECRDICIEIGETINTRLGFYVGHDTLHGLWSCRWDYLHGQHLRTKGRLQGSENAQVVYTPIEFVSDRIKCCPMLSGHNTCDNGLAMGVFAPDTPVEKFEPCTAQECLCSKIILKEQEHSIGCKVTWTAAAVKGVSLSSSSTIRSYVGCCRTKLFVQSSRTFASFVPHLFHQPIILSILSSFI